MIENDQEDEQMLLVAHKHWATLVGDAILTLIPGFTILGLLFLFRGVPQSSVDIPIQAIATFLVPLCFLIIWTILAIQWTNYYLDMLVVSDRRIFYTKQINFAQRSIQQWNIPDVRQVNVHLGNIFESYFNYGSLEISVEGEAEPIKIDGIPDPQHVSAVILKQDNRYGDLRETARKQRELLHFLSHEVKGHLAKSKAAFAAIVEGDFGAINAPLDTLAHRALADSQKGVDTVMSILDNSDLKEGTVRFNKTSFDLSATINRVVQEIHEQAQSKGLALQVYLDPPCFMVGDENKIERHVIRNLIENAIKYTPAGHIEINLQKVPGALRLSVSDTGVGIAAGDIDKLFTQGGHGEHSKDINADSTGYGLFIAKQVVEKHGGRMWALSNGPKTGSQFFAEFPLA